MHYTQLHTITRTLQLKATCNSLEQQLAAAQAEARASAGQLRKTGQQLEALHDEHSTAQASLARLRDERQRLLAVRTHVQLHKD